jgi:hypothetical protein
MPDAYLRRLNHHEFWAEYSDQIRAGNLTYPDEIRAEIEAEGGMSVFRFNNANQQLRIATALTLTRDVKPFRGVVITEAMLANFGFVARPSHTDVGVFDLTLWKSHFDLVPAGTASDPGGFARTIALQSSRVLFETSDMFQFIAREMNANRWKREDVFRKSDQLNTMDVMLRHFRKKHLELNHP